jgi:hypothetical protein
MQYTPIKVDTTRLENSEYDINTILRKAWNIMLQLRNIQLKCIGQSQDLGSLSIEDEHPKNRKGIIRVEGHDLEDRKIWNQEVPTSEMRMEIQVHHRYPKFRSDFLGGLQRMNYHWNTWSEVAMRLPEMNIQI